MADTEENVSSAPPNGRREDEEEARDAASKARSPKKKKVRRHRIQKVEGLGKVEEETDEEEEGERKTISSRERRLSRMSLDGIDPDDVPTLNYVIEEKPPVIVVEEPEVDDVPAVLTEVPPIEDEEEFDDDDPCMTEEEKEAMYNAAALGDIDLLEDCLDKENSDINMVWFQENLLMAALKTEQEEMAEFLIDNGVDYNFSTTLINVKDQKTAREIEWQTCTCRQMAYDRGLHDITDLIDYLNGELFPFIRLKPRIPRYRRPKPPTPEPSTGGESENDAGSEASKDRSDDEGDGKARKKRKKKKKDSREEDVEKIKEGDSDKQKTEKNKEKKTKKPEKTKETLAINDEDSGHHSSESFADTERDEEGRKSADRSKHLSRASSSKTRTGSSRCSTSFTSTTTRSPSPPPVRSETFLKRFCFLSACPSDEGYSSLSSSQRSPRMSETKLRRQRVPITIPPRGTKSFFGMKQASLHRKANAEQEDERPLTQRKIKIPGSYGEESSRWYKKPKDSVSSVTQSTNDMTNITQKEIQNTSSTEVPKPQHAHYMQMTASAFTKRKLEPNFRKAYTSLDFVSDRLSRSTHVSGNRKILHQRPTMNPRTYTRRGRENISLDLKTYNPSMLRPHSLPSSVNNQLFRTVIRVH